MVDDDWVDNAQVPSLPSCDYTVPSGDFFINDQQWRTNWCEAGGHYWDEWSMFGDVFMYGGLQQPYHWTDCDERTGNPCANARGMASAVKIENGKVNLLWGDANATLTAGLHLTSSGFDLGLDDGEFSGDGRGGDLRGTGDNVDGNDDGRGTGYQGGPGVTYRELAPMLERVAVENDEIKKKVQERSRCVRKERQRSG